MSDEHERSGDVAVYSVIHILFPYNSNADKLIQTWDTPISTN